jgi:Uma2 family endonuclease
MRKTSLFPVAMTFDEYLAFENASPVRHEYVRGEVHAMTGASVRHNKIIGNLYRVLHAAARGSACGVFFESVKLRAANEVMYYPDIMVACGEAADVDEVIEAPCLIVEVTSPSTAATDRREKLTVYREIPSLRAYLLVEQRRRQAIVYTRTLDRAWERKELMGEESVELPCLRCRLTLDEVYDSVRLPTMRVGEAAFLEDEERAAEEEIELEERVRHLVR